MLFEAAEDATIELDGEIHTVRAGQWLTTSHPVEVKLLELRPELFVRVEDAPKGAQAKWNGG